MSLKFNKNFLVAAVVLVVVVFFTFLLFNLNKKNTEVQLESNAKNLNIKSKDGVFSLDRSGQAVWETNNGEKSGLWETGKTNSFFDYIFATYGEGENFVVNDDDELVSAVFSEESNSSNSNDGDISSYFQSPTPSSGVSGGSGGGGSSGGGSGGGSSSDNGIPSWCKHWRLSYCADTPPPNPTQSPSPTVTPIPGIATPLPPDCNNVGNQVTGKTVIGNELCLPSVTP